MELLRALPQQHAGWEDGEGDKAVVALNANLSLIVLCNNFTFKVNVK